MSNIKYELKACPFCGGYARLRKSNRTFIGGQTVRNCYVHCSVCDARAERFIEGDTAEEHAEARRRAVEAWNRRAEEQEHG